MNYCITVHKEVAEFTKLLSLLLDHKYDSDKIYVIHDTKTEFPSDQIDLIHKMCLQNPVEYQQVEFDGDFSKLKNMFSDLVPKNEFIFQLDADELPTKQLIKDAPGIVTTNRVELIHIARRNIVDGITPQHIVKWKWFKTDKGFINYPDYQGRIYFNMPRIKWEGKVHERLTGMETSMVLPDEPYDWAIIHTKSIATQEKQNQYYEENY